MNYLDLAAVKAHLRVTHDDEDATIMRYYLAAQAYARQHLNMEIIFSGTPSDTQVILDDGIISAILLITADLYENRSDVVTGIATANIAAADRILNRYRRPAGM